MTHPPERGRSPPAARRSVEVVSNIPEPLHQLCCCGPGRFAVRRWRFQDAPSEKFRRRSVLCQRPWTATVASSVEKQIPIMSDLLESLVDGLDTQSKKRDERVTRRSRIYRCRCGNHIFFDNTLCLACKSPLGLLPDEGRVAALDPGPTPGTWRVEGRRELSKFWLAAPGCRGQQRARAPGHAVPVGALGSEPVRVRSQCASPGFEPGVAMIRQPAGSQLEPAGSHFHASAPDVAQSFTCASGKTSPCQWS